MSTEDSLWNMQFTAVFKSFLMTTLNFGKCSRIYKNVYSVLEEILTYLFEFVGYIFHPLMYLFFPIRVPDFEIYWSLLLKVCFHEILRLFLIIFTFCIYRQCCLGQGDLCSFHCFHKLCSNNVLFLSTLGCWSQGPTCLMWRWLLLLLCLFPGQSRVLNPTQWQSKCLARCGPGTSCAGRGCGLFF